jgi:hypothetical protein
MRLNLIKCILLGTMVLAPLGCEPQPVVVDEPDDDTAIIEDRETVIERDADTDADPGGVDVNVGGERGVDVGVNPDTTDETP